MSFKLRGFAKRFVDRLLYNLQMEQPKKRFPQGYKNREPYAQLTSLDIRWRFLGT